MVLPLPGTALGRVTLLGKNLAGYRLRLRDKAFGTRGSGSATGERIESLIDRSCRVVHSGATSLRTPGVSTLQQLDRIHMMHRLRPYTFFILEWDSGVATGRNAGGRHESHVFPRWEQ